ncbi:interleukin-8 [Anguilla anguilla]|uniref:Chemokine interleukin-8-like domain-containing protein n=1 Tax=Anguilla anguilla TaxID=7936 RepID=A0A9D3RIM4_ANGAN|nr:interleukin-8 [Anguilla anguilla]KAG5831704.1 hypothetical protein ANANG_G00306560 [Anguilla anguilla]
MRFYVHALSVLVAFTLSIFLNKDQLGESAFVPMRCLCPQTNPVIRRPLIDFLVIRKGPHCPTAEIIVKLANNKELCLSPKGQQGKRLRRCWNRSEKNGGDKKKCLQRRRRKAQQRKGLGQTPGMGDTS